MKLVKLTPMLALIFIICFVTARGQQPAATPSPTPSAPTSEVSAEKRALIKEILDLTNSRQGTEAMFNAQFEQMEKQMPDIQWQAISSLDEFKKLTPAQQQDLRAKVKQSSTRLSQRIKTLFLQRIDMKQMVEDISYTVYDKHFTEAELKDLVAFYRSETGKKVITEMPAVFADSIAKAGEIISPKVQQIVEETQRDQSSELTQEINRLMKSPPKAPAKKATPSRRRP